MPENKTNTKLDAVEAAVQQIRKKYGTGAIMRLGEKPPVHADVIHTGSLGQGN